MEQTENIYQSAEKKSNTILMLRTAVGVLVALGMIAAALFIGMQRENARQLMTIDNFAELTETDTNVVIKTNDFDYSGIYYYGKNENKPTSFVYYVFFEDEDGYYDVIAVKAKKDYRADNDLERDARPVRTFYGKIAIDTERRDNVQQFEKVYETEPGRADEILPDYYVNALPTRFSLVPDWMFFAIIPLILAAGSISALVRRRKYKGRMENFGITDASYLSLDREMQGEIFKSAKNVIITKSWLFNKVAADTYLFPLNRVVWVYQSVTKHYTNGIRSGTTYAVNLCFNDGEMQTITSTKKQVDDLQAFISARCPNAILAFSDDLKNLWAIDKEEFCRIAATSCRAAMEQAPVQIEEENRYGSDDRFAPRSDDNA